MHGTSRLITASRFWTLFFVVTLFSGIVAAHAQEHWDFEGGRENEAPMGFSFARTGSGRVGHWVITTAADAPSGTHVLAQVDADATDFRFPVAVANKPSLADVRLSVKCKPMAGTVDQVCGLVFRYQDDKNYYVTRANALEGNVRLYHAS